MIRPKENWNKEKGYVVDEAKRTRNRPDEHRLKQKRENTATGNLVE